MSSPFVRSRVSCTANVMVEASDNVFITKVEFTVNVIVLAHLLL
ncbi:MAG: hypothetical protein KAS29_21620 [Bacteroidales bacterium]|nr:hypothetical protein [Bacteroidales bacterium]